MKKQNKGFTIVELVIVIAVIAILAAVLIPTFSNIIKKAQTSSDTQLIRNLNGALAIALAEDGEDKFNTANDAFNAVEEAGYNVAKIVSKSGYNIAWDKETGHFVLLDEQNETVLYPVDMNTNEVTKLTADNKVNYFVVRTNVTTASYDVSEYSLYCGLKFSATTINLNGVGLDVGDNKDILNVNYTNGTTNNNVVIRTNTANTTVTIDDKSASGKIHHYGTAGSVIITDCAPTSYYENGVVPFFDVKEGRIVLEETSDVSVINITKTTDSSFGNIIIADGGAKELPEIISRDKVTVPTSETNGIVVLTVQKLTSDGNVESTETVKAYPSSANSSTVKTETQNTTVSSALGQLALDAAGEEGQKAYETAAKEAKKNEAVAVVLEVERLEDLKEKNYWIGCASDKFAGGEGTESDPYQIATAEQLSRLAYLINGNGNSEYKTKYYKLTSDIDLSGKCWIPISAYDRKDDANKFFNGFFDGNKKTISGLNSVGLSISYVNTMLNDSSPINADGEYVYGLFGTVTGVTIKDLTLNNVTIKVGTGEESSEGIYVGDSVGSLIGYAYTRSYSDIINISNVEVNGTIEGYDCVGGLIGQIRSEGGGNFSVLGSITLKECTTNIDVVAIRRASCFIGGTNKYGYKLVKFDGCTNTKKATSKGINADFEKKEGIDSNYYDAAILMSIQGVDGLDVTMENYSAKTENYVINLTNTGSIERNTGNVKDETLYLFH